MSYIGSCFTLSGPVYWINPWTGFGFNETGLLFGYWDAESNAKVAMMVICVLTMVASLTSLSVFSYLSSCNLQDDQDLFSQVRTVWMPITVFTWQFFVGIAVLFNVLFGISSTTNTMIFVHGLVEIFMLTTLILLYRNNTLSAKTLCKFVLFYLVATLLTLILFATAGNVHVQAVMVIIAAIPDIGSPVMTTLLLITKLKGKDRVTYGLLDALLIIHILTFAVPILICNQVHAAAIYMVVLMGVNLLFNVPYTISTFYTICEV